MQIITPMFRKILVSLGLVFMIQSLQAQGQVNVKASLDSTVLLIGQQSLYHLEISGPSNLIYSLPAFPGDTIVTGLDILARGPLDTVSIGNGHIELKTDYLITSFDSGLYYIPPVKILAGNDTIESNYLAIKVMTYDVDTTKMEIFDIKGVQKPPFVLGDYLMETLLFLLIYGLVLLSIWLYLRKKYRKSTAEDLTPESLLPPHVVAIMELDRLRSEKLWKLGKNKQYYTELSEILRKYIERRFQINALEMTSEEILILFKRDKTTQSVYQNLRQILQLSDLVKFAKIEPLESENELSIMNSYLFVNQTKLEEVKSLEEQMEKLSKENEENEEVATDAKDKSSEERNKYMPQ
jgi:hypothetical protein